MPRSRLENGGLAAQTARYIRVSLGQHPTKRSSYLHKSLRSLIKSNTYVYPPDDGRLVFAGCGKVVSAVTPLQVPHLIVVY